MFFAFLSAILIIFGIVNLLSEKSGIIGWVLLVSGLVILFKKLSWSTNPNRNGKTNDGSASSPAVGSDCSSDASGGGCGGGGE